MPKQHGRIASIYFEDSAGACTSFTGDGNSISFSPSIDAPEVTAFGDNTRQFLAGGLRTYELSMDGFVNMPTGAACVALGIINSASGVTVMTYGPAGSTSGSQKFMACVVMTEFTYDNPVDGPITFSLTVQPRSGSLTASTW